MRTAWPFAPQFFEMNRQRLTNLMEPDTMAIIFSNDQMPRNGDQYFPYRQSSDLFHQTGIEQEKSILLLYPNCPVEKYREVLFIMRPDENLERWEGVKLNADRARGISGVRTIMYTDEFDTVLRETMFHAEQVYLDNTEYARFNPDVSSRSLRFGIRIHHEYPFHQYRRLGPLLARVRSEKCDAEIAVIREACTITAGAFRRAVSILRPGVKEYEIQAEIEHEFRIRQASGHAFHPIIASGINATYLHYNQNQDICEEGDLLLLDFGCEYFGYASDLSRTVPVNGIFNPRQKELYNAVLGVYKQVKPLFTVGQTIEGIQTEVNGLLQEAMIRLRLFTHDEVKNQNPASPLFMKYFPHGVSHHVGLDVHDPGKKQDPLRPGMVVSLEPGIYIPAEQTGIRIETDLLITRATPVDLFDGLETETEEIESLFRK
ncbi:MAG TPA: aminopeptidase P N-terminal domain-containing protein [Bacteroidales bacterium]|nr:aminopeptidase P N-terminal domain-containing protein [Bacteroidales bacterium]HRZ48523.1 aminopeptidase P N-terminal domain-containing protein [Bacteroidales bacterium]